MALLRELLTVLLLLLIAGGWAYAILSLFCVRRFFYFRNLPLGKEGIRLFPF